MGNQTSAQNFIESFIERLPDTHPLVGEFRAALAGDIDPQSPIENQGLWEITLLSMGGNLKSMSGHSRLFIAIERSSYEPTRLMRSGDMPGAVSLLQTDPVISMFLWPDAITAMQCCKEEKQLLAVRAAIASEVLLSYVAAADAELASTNQSSFICLIPGEHAPGKNPTSLFFECLRNAIGVKSLPAFLDHPKAKGLSLDMSTLKRWSAGSHCPDPVWLRPILKAFFDDPDYSPINSRYIAAKHLSLIGFFTQKMVTKTLKLPAMSEQASVMRPWPDYPFGYSNCESWMQSRYPYWFDYHLKQKQVLHDRGEKRPIV